MVRRRGDESYAGRGMTHLGDPRLDFLTRQLAAFAGLCALGHFDLQFPGIYEVGARDAEPAGSDLLDSAVLGIAALVGPDVALGIFAAFAGIALAADPVHGDGQGFVGFLA